MLDTGGFISLLLPEECVYSLSLILNEKLETDLKIALARSSITASIHLVLSAFLCCHYPTVLESSVRVSAAALHYTLLNCQSPDTHRIKGALLCMSWYKVH